MSAARVMRMIFGDGFEFWRADTEDLLQEAAQSLLDHGYSTEEAEELLSSLWGAVSQEYGG